MGNGMLLDTLIKQDSTVWAGSEAAFHEVVAAYKKMGEADDSVRKDALYRDEEDEENDTHFLLDIVNSVGVITVRGSMVPGSEGRWGQYWGVVGYDDIRNAAITAINNGVEELLFVYDTPGGAVKGIQELSDFIRSIEVPTTSFTGESAMSGGLWLATASDKFYAARMAEIGSLGVIAVTFEMTEAYKEAGIGVKVFKSTPLKAAGNRYEKLTKEMEDEIQKNIMQTDQFFIRAIAENRSLSESYVAENIANGKVWYAAEARELNLIDGIKTFDNTLLAMIRETTDNINNFQHVQDNDMARRKVISEQQAAAIASGVKVEDALEGTNLESAVEDEVSNDDVASEASGEDSPETNTGAEAESSAQNEKTLQDTIVDLKVELRHAQDKLVTLEATQAGLKQVTAVAVQRAFVAIGSPAPSLEGLLALDASALLQQHALVDAQLSQRFGAGKQITSVIEEEEDEAVAEAARLTNEALLKQARI